MLNPPYSYTVIAYVAKRFLHLLGLHFLTSNKFINLSVGIIWSYCRTQIVGNIMKLHNKTLINSSNYHAQPGNCTKDFPSEGKCRTENTIYKYIISISGQPDKVHLGNAGDF